MLDILAGLFIVAVAILVWGTLLRLGIHDASTRRTAALGVLAWFGLIVTLAMTGALGPPNGTFVIGAAALTPVLAGLIAMAGSPSLRSFVLAIPLTALVAVQVGRVVGGFFLALESAGRMPHTFASIAGWGDVAVGVLAIPVAWAVLRQAPGWRASALAWNVLGILDLVTAVTLGVGSADSPLRFIHESPSTRVFGTLPWALVPGFMVPTYLLVHVATFARLRRQDQAQAGVPRSAAPRRGRGAVATSVKTEPGPPSPDVQPHGA